VVIQSHMVLDHRVFCALAVWVEPSHSSVPERERGGEGGGEGWGRGGREAGREAGSMYNTIIEKTFYREHILYRLTVQGET